MQILVNNVVKLIPMELEHIEGIYEAAQDKRIWEHMSVDLTDKSRVIQYVKMRYKNVSRAPILLLSLSIKKQGVSSGLPGFSISQSRINGSKSAQHG